MSRFTVLEKRQVCALFSLCGNAGAALVRDMAHESGGQAWAYRRVAVTVGEAIRYCEVKRIRVPPLLHELMNDDREYPAWLHDLVSEWRLVRRYMTGAKRPALEARTAHIKTAKAWEAHSELLPALERRGHLDGDLPPETIMEDRWQLMHEEEDDNG